MQNEQYRVLIEKASEMFKKHGIKSLTMDEIARELGMSKKTIYRFVENKAELVKLVVEDYLNTDRQQIEGLLTGSDNALEEMVRIADYSIQQIREFNARSLNDLEKYYPETWAVFTNYRFNYVLSHIKENLTNGARQGLYRANVNADVLAKLYIGGFDLLTNQALFPVDHYNFLKIYKEYLNFYLRGIVSAKGLQLLEQHNDFK